MTQAHLGFKTLLGASFTMHAKRTSTSTQIACAVMQGSHLVVDVGQEALEISCLSIRNL